MGARIGKLLTDTMSHVESEIEDRWDLEQGDECTSGESSISSNSEVDETMLHEPYIVEKRFIAGSNECTYNIIKRK